MKPNRIPYRNLENFKKPLQSRSTVMFIAAFADKDINPVSGFAWGVCLGISVYCWGVSPTNLAFYRCIGNYGGFSIILKILTLITNS